MRHGERGYGIFKHEDCVPTAASDRGLGRSMAVHLRYAGSSIVKLLVPDTEESRDGQVQSETMTIMQRWLRRECSLGSRQRESVAVVASGYQCSAKCYLSKPSKVYSWAGEQDEVRMRLLLPPMLMNLKPIKSQDLQLSQECALK